MKYIFSEQKLVFKKHPSEAGKNQPEFLDLSKNPEIGVEKNELREGIKAQNKEERKVLKEKIAPKLSKELVKKLSKKEIVVAFNFIEKNKFKPEKVKAMLAISDKMSVYNLWSGGVRRLGKEKGLKENQGFSRMAAQFAVQGEDSNGKYLEINLYGKSKFESNIGAGHICPPSWQKVKIVDKSGNARIGIRKIPGIDNVDGHKIGYYDKNGEYLAVYTGYKVYPLSILSEKDQKDKKIIDSQVLKEKEYYVKNKKELEAYVDRASYSVARMEMTPVAIQKIRDKISGLENIKEPGDRVAAVATWITKNENIYAKHCGNWVKRVYAIAGVTRQKGLYHNLAYARSNGKWKSKLGMVPDARNGKNALNERPNLVANLRIGDWLWINNRNRFDVGGNHSLIFMGWKDKDAKIAYCASWSNNSVTKSGKKGQRMITINFNSRPITHIERPTQVEDKFTRLSKQEMQQVEEVENKIEKSPVANYKEKARRYAKEVQAKYGVPWQVTFGMSCLETGYGKSGLSRNENAFFGIKAKPGDRNITNPYKGDRYRKYASMKDSFMDYGRFVTKARYTEALKYKNNPMMYLAVLLGAGYCPANKYFRQVMSIWKREGVPGIGYISKGSLANSLHKIAYKDVEKGGESDKYILRITTPAKLQAKFYGPASRVGLLRA